MHVYVTPDWATDCGYYLFINYLEYIMKLSIELHDGYANTPEFKIDWGTIEFDAPHIIPLPDVNGHGRAWYLAFNYDLSILNYRALCEFKTDGNTNFGYPEGGYASGWSSRVSCVNKDLGYNYVDVSQRGIELDKLLYMIKDKYVGEVFIAKRENATDKEYVIQPYFHEKHGKYMTELNYMTIHTIEPEFVELCLSWLTGSTDMLKMA